MMQITQNVINTMPTNRPVDKGTARNAAKANITVLSESSLMPSHLVSAIYRKYAYKRQVDESNDCIKLFILALVCSFW